MKKINCDIIPTVSINKIAFGTDRKKVRKILGKPERTFMKTPFSKNTTDAYSDFHVYYSPDDKLDAIEFWGNNVSISIQSNAVFPGDIQSAKALLSDLSGDNEYLISKESSIGISVEDGIIVSILVGRKDYYKE